MSAFNRLRYNISKYNIEPPTGLIWLEGKSESRFNFIFAGIDIFMHGQSKVLINSNEPRADKGKIVSGTSSAVINGSAKVVSLINLSGIVDEEYKADVVLSQNAYINGTSDILVDSESNLSQEAYINGNSDVLLNTTKMDLGQIIYESVNFGEVFQASVDVVSLTEYICEFPELILKPGQSLIIDSGSYNVLLDGENAIHLQNGDWFDNLSRATQNITISGTNATNLSASILYIERYL